MSSPRAKSPPGGSKGQARPGATEAEPAGDRALQQQLKAAQEAVAREASERCYAQLERVRSSG